MVPAVPYHEALVVTAVDATVDPRSDRRDAARRTLGVSGESAVDEPAPLRPILRQHQLTVYPMVALGLLGIVDSFQGYAFSVLTPEISRTLGLSLGAIAGARTLAFLAAILAPLPVAAISQRPGRRALMCVATGIAWSIITVMTGFVMSLLALIVVLVLDGLSTGSVQRVARSTPGRFVPTESARSRPVRLSGPGHRRSGDLPALRRRPRRSARPHLAGCLPGDGRHVPAHHIGGARPA